MLAEFLEKLREQYEISRDLDFITHPRLPSKVFANGPDGVTAWIREPDPRQHFLASYESVVRFVGTTPRTPEMGEPEIYVAPHGITVVLDGSKRQDFAFCQLHVSDPMRKLMALEQNELPMTPKELYLFLRKWMCDNRGLFFDGAAAIAGHLGHLDFAVQSGSSAAVKHGRESFGKSVEAQVKDASTIPEVVTMDVPTWTTEGFQSHTRRMHIGIYLDPDAGTIMLKPTNDQCVSALNHSMSEVAERLRSSLPGIEDRIYCGEYGPPSGSAIAPIQTRGSR